ncbi:MAG: class I SAM-dependent RNA methyltransferase [Clostridiaceae bacterium]|nr:class I SAM-dependent RNA methyltransferase [Clostridiaceae bacterium]
MEGKINLIATSSFGVEAIVAGELRKLGYKDMNVKDGKVTFEAPVSAICRANLWLRCADRVFLKMGEFEAETFDQLFEGTKAIAWERWIPKDAAFPVTGSCIRSKLMSISDCQSIIKKAVVERLKLRYRLNIFPETGQRYKIVFWILKDQVILAIDTSGDGLHKRGYRRLTTAAPLKETLASALLYISRWNEEKPLIDPFCGSGTIPIEAALMGLNIAPGINRSFDAMNWPEIDSKFWNESVEEARDLIRRVTGLKIYGYDMDAGAVETCRFHAKEAGVGEMLHFQVRDMKQTSSRFEYGIVVTNPPYGDRLGNKNENALLYRDMSKAFRTNLRTWSYYIISSDIDFERHFGEKANRKRKLYNGGIMCYLYQYYGPKPPQKGLKSDKTAD